MRDTYWLSACTSSKNIQVFRLYRTGEDGNHYDVGDFAFTPEGKAEAVKTKDLLNSNTL